MFRSFLFTSVAAVSLVALIALAVLAFLYTTPRPTNIKDCLTTEMYKVRLCPKEGTYARLKEISPFVRAAVIVSEDGGFYDHHGIDWFEMRESFEKNWRMGRFARGGSTLTQQLAKNVYLSSEKSILRKLREAIIALQLESLLSKDEILEKYLNVVEFGPNIYGVKQAAQYYFHKNPRDLSILESAWLAFLLPNPKKYSTSFRKKELSPFARKQIKQIVLRMSHYKKISEEDTQYALADIHRLFGGDEPTESAADMGAESNVDMDADTPSSAEEEEYFEGE